MKIGNIDFQLIKNLNLFKWPIAAVIAVFAGKIFDVFPFVIERLYYRGIFQIFRSVYDHTLGFMPIPMVYLLFCVLVYVIYKFLGNIWVNRKKQNYKAILLSSINFISIIVLCFYFFWGFNYYLPGIANKLDFKTSKMSSEDLYQETLHIDSLLADYRKEIVGDTSVSISYESIPEDLEGILRKNQEKILSNWGYPTWGRVRIRKLKPQGILLRLSTAGVYIPFVFEGHIDKGLHPLQYPFTMAHEMAHGYGITDEGECNFVGFVTCINSKNEIIRYSAYLTYFRYLLNNLRRTDIECYLEIARNLDPVIRKDINDIMIQMNKYPDIIPEFRDIIYDSYLKSHGVKEGLASYSSIIKLINQWKQSENDQNLIKHIYPL